MALRLKDWEKGTEGIRVTTGDFKVWEKVLILQIIRRPLPAGSCVKDVVSGVNKGKLIEVRRTAQISRGADKRGLARGGVGGASYNDQNGEEGRPQTSIR